MMGMVVIIINTYAYAVLILLSVCVGGGGGGGGSKLVFSSFYVLDSFCSACPVLFSPSSLQYNLTIMQYFVYRCGIKCCTLRPAQR